MCALPSQQGLEKLVRRSDNPDPYVHHMLTLIRSGHKFTHQSWKGGVKDDDVFKPMKVEEGQSSHSDMQKSSSGTTPYANGNTNVSEGFNKGAYINVESPHRIVRNVLADLNAVAKEDLSCGDGSRAEDEEYQQPEHVVQDTEHVVQDIDRVTDTDSHPIPLDESEVWEEPVILLGHTGVDVVLEKDAKILLPATVSYTLVYE
ncbi:unnamed protein product [Cochlearia groenlandica]